MIDNEIIKALKCCKKAKINQDCVVLKCPFSTEYGCNIGLENLRNEALDLINRQKAEIERLKESGKEAVSCFTRMESLYKIKCKELEVAKSEAIKEFAEIFENKLHTCDVVGDRDNVGYITSDVHRIIYNLVKERTEVNEN